MLKDESTFSQFLTYHLFVRRPVNKYFEERYVPNREECIRNRDLWLRERTRMMSIVFVKNAIITGNVYLDVLKDRLHQFVDLHGTTIFNEMEVQFTWLEKLSNGSKLRAMSCFLHGQEIVQTWTWLKMLGFR